MKITGTTILLSDRDNSSQESFDRVLQAFKKQMKKFGIIKEVRDRMAFVSKSEKKKRKRERIKK